MQELHGGGTVLLCLRTIFWQAVQIRYPEYARYNRELYALFGGSRLMLKGQTDGNEERYYLVRKILNNNSKIEVTEFSDLYPNKGQRSFTERMWK